MLMPVRCDLLWDQERGPGFGILKLAGLNPKSRSMQISLMRNQGTLPYLGKEAEWQASETFHNVNIWGRDGEFLLVRVGPEIVDMIMALPITVTYRLYLSVESTKLSCTLRIVRPIFGSSAGNRERLNIVSLARRAAKENNLSNIDKFSAQLQAGAAGFLEQTQKIHNFLKQIAGLQRKLDTLQRAAFREPFAAQLLTLIENFMHLTTSFSEPLATEFHNAAVQWARRAKQQLDDVSDIMSRRPTLQVFRAGDPIDRTQEAFVPRMSVIEALEQQLMLANGCPGLLLYGRRRMGKSTLLRNLEGFIDSSVRVASMSMQDPRAFSSLALCAQHLAEGALRAAGMEEPIVADGVKTLDALFRLLERVNDRLRDENIRLLLACDEYEQIDTKISEGVFSSDLLSLVRESVQRHRRLIWLFAGSHRIDELTHAEWPSYFVSLRTQEIGPFTEAETRLLLSEPLKHSPLYRQCADATRFDPCFWGEGGIPRIHTEAGGWPHLVQLLAETAVDLANDRGVDHLDDTDFEEICRRAVVAGDTVLRQLVQRECAVPNEWEYLLHFRKCEAQAPPADEGVFSSLRRRLLVVVDKGMWRLRVPLMRRWLIERA